MSSIYAVSTYEKSMWKKRCILRKKDSYYFSVELAKMGKFNRQHDCNG